MGFEVKTGFLGIVTNTSELQAPPGALLRAKNVVIRRAGACEQRPGILDYDTFTASPISAVQKLIPYKDNTLIQYTTGSADAWHDLKNDAAVAVHGPHGLDGRPAGVPSRPCRAARRRAATCTWAMRAACSSGRARATS